MHVYPKLLAALLFLVVGAMTACDDTTERISVDPPLERITGNVVEIHDSIPADGEARVKLRRVDGTTLEVYLPSLFTAVPPDQATQDAFERVYPVILSLGVGDRVEALGEYYATRLRLSYLRKL